MFDNDSVLIFERYYNILLESSKQNIVNLGYPKMIADIIYNKFLKNSFVVAKWIKETNIYKTPKGEEKAWWYYSNRGSFFSKGFHNLGLADWVDLYDSASSIDNYIKQREDMDIPIDEESKNDLDLDDVRNFIKAKIDEKLMNEYIFNTSLLRGMMGNRIKNMKEYSSLPFQEALDKYNEKNIFEDTTPLKVYDNGYKWINVGGKCELIGSKMSNCGSVGVMSMDENATIISLFDASNKPHVVVTYSPSEHRISGIEGVAGSITKSEYHDYIIDIADHLKANIDYLREKSKLLALKSMLKDNYRDIQVIHADSYGPQYMSVTMNDGKKYITNFDNFIPYDKLDANQQDLINELREQFQSAHMGYNKNAINKSNFLDSYNIPMFRSKY